MTELHNAAVSVALTPRQHRALKTYCGALMVPMSEYLRTLICAEIPPEYWTPEPPPPGQLQIDGAAT